MATLAEQVQGELIARVAVSMLAEPNDAATGRVLAQGGGIETLRLVESNDPVPGLARADALMWRERLATRITPDLPDQVLETQRQEFGTLVPDEEWPSGLDDLGDRAPNLLWTRWATSFLAAALSDRVTITGARASTSYGEHVTGDLATGMADEECTVVGGGAHGVEGAAHRAVLAAGGQTIAVLAGGLDRPYPAGHSDRLRQIGDVGLLVGKLPPGAAPAEHRFWPRSTPPPASPGTSRTIARDRVLFYACLHSISATLESWLWTPHFPSSLARLRTASRGHGLLAQSARPGTSDSQRPPRMKDTIRPLRATTLRSSRSGFPVRLSSAVSARIPSADRPCTARATTAWTTPTGPTAMISSIKASRIPRTTP
jgi:hypothetical protein